LNSKKLLSKLTEKWPVKILAIAAALVISIFYRMNTLETRFFSVPLQIRTNESLVLANSISNTVRISLRGEPEVIQQILEEDIESYIDLARYTNEGTFKAPVQIRKKNSALGITPLEISVLPIEIIIELEHSAKRTIIEENNIIKTEEQLQTQVQLQVKSETENDNIDLNPDTEKEAESEE